ncbi:MAG: hypothetical protein Q4B54_12850, partial [Coriobacteriales bacterium]|nr:hypothetical protein [Coriobacteriales bacterium]
MSLEVKAILLVVLVVVVGAMMVTYVKNFLGKSVRGALHVPQGKNRVHADVLDSQPLKPYKYSQVFEVQVSAEERTIKDEISGQSLTSTGALIYKNAPIGFIDPTTSHAIALAKLADK